jgi:hypothetical protein
VKFKIFRVVSPLAGGKEGTLAFPPISVGILTRHMRDCGFDMYPDDLHRRWYSTFSAGDTERLRGISEDEQRMWRYLEGAVDEYWDWFGEKVTTLSDFKEPDAFLLSMISSDLGCCVATLAFARYLKKRFNRPIILGGEYWVQAPIYDEIERVLSLGVLDYYIIGFGEEPLEHLLTIISGRPTTLTCADVRGLCYMEDGKVFKNSFVPEHPLIPPDFDGLPIDLYRWTADCPPPSPNLPTPQDELTLPFHTSTGCPYNCTFCDASGIKKMWVLPPKKAVEELKNLVNRYNCRTFFFLDDTLNLSPRHINQLCDGILEARLDIQWMTCASPRGMDKATLKKMREAGVIRIVWGLESGSNRLLEYVKKPMKLEVAAEVYSMSHEVGIWNGVECIVGLPTETEEEFEQTMNFLEEHVEILDEVWAYQFYLNSNSDMFTNNDQYGLTNVRRVNKGLTKDAAFGAVAASHIFDEKDGLCWAEKEEQMKRRHGVILEHVARLGLYPMTWEHEQQPNLLSWCYRHCSTKAEVRRVYYRYWEKLALRRTWAASGKTGDSPEALALEIYREFEDRQPRPGLDDMWQSSYPDKWIPTYPQLTPGLVYERSLLMDGRLHDMLVYSRLKERLTENQCNAGLPQSEATWV